MRLRRQQSEVRLDLTPLIDVVFLLLTFFIFSMILMIRADVLDVSLPTLGSAATTDPGVAVTVAVLEDGTIAVEGELVAATGVAARVLQLREQSPDARLLLAVDENAPSKDLLAVADVLASSGLGEFSVLSRPADRSAGAAQPRPEASQQSSPQPGQETGPNPSPELRPDPGP
ncbi:MAG: biopolymer transporter ExbD [Planctomycetota bacterium]